MSQGLWMDLQLSMLRSLAQRVMQRSEGEYDVQIGRRVRKLPKGENGWQSPAGHYATIETDPLALHAFQHISGNEPSYNNLCDVDRLLQTLTHIAGAFVVNVRPEEDNARVVPYMAVVAKHGNACGAAFGSTRIAVIEKLLRCDPLASFGGIVMTNFPLELSQGAALAANPNIKFDGVCAPAISGGAISYLRRKKDACFFLENRQLADLKLKSLDTALRRRYVRGGYLLQPNYTQVLHLFGNIACMTGELTPGIRALLALAWAIGSTSNSNTITIVNDDVLLGNGVGQQARVYASRLAVERATTAGHGLSLRGSVAYSDSFFVHSDALEVLANAGVGTVLTSSGSVHDRKVQERALDLKLNLIMIPDAEIRGFYHH